MKDRDKLMTIAQTYSFIKGEFSAYQLYKFILEYNFKFHSDFTARSIGTHLSRSSKFKKVEGNPVKYYAI